MVSTDQIEVSSARPRAALIRNPTGCCIHEFAARMKYADSQVPTAVAQIVSRCRRGDSRSHPKIHKPMKVDSRKNASRPSIASGAPKMSPTNREYALQFMPNWNSCTSPVTTPMAKLMRNNLPQNFVIRLYFRSPVRKYAVCIPATTNDNASVIGTKKKWYTVTMPNCQREMSSVDTDPPPLLCRFVRSRSASHTSTRFRYAGCPCP